jgi:V-type H+-transporting ATPase subunit a
MDGVWSLSTNKLQVMNSLKMKMAIVIGVIHMVFGILLKGLNCLYFKKGSGFFFEFLPELLFMLATFGYMSFLIIIKW